MRYEKNDEIKKHTEKIHLKNEHNLQILSLIDNWILFSFQIKFCVEFYFIKEVKRSLFYMNY